MYIYGLHWYEIWDPTFIVTSVVPKDNSTLRFLVCLNVRVNWGRVVAKVGCGASEPLHRCLVCSIHLQNISFIKLRSKFGLVMTAIYYDFWIYIAQHSKHCQTSLICLICKTLPPRWGADCRSCRRWELWRSLPAPSSRCCRGTATWLELSTTFCERLQNIGKVLCFLT